MAYATSRHNLLGKRPLKALEPQHATGGGRGLHFLLVFIDSEEKCNDCGRDIVSRIYQCKLIYIRQRHPNTNRVTRQIASLQHPGL